MDALHEKLRELQEYLRELGSVAIAFSAGVDSTFLLKVAHDTLGDKAIAVTAKSCSFPKRELQEAVDFCEKERIEHIVIESEELSIEGFRQNPKNRCYLCKHELFEKIGEVAREREISYMAEGSNMDDNGDYRPGLMAVAELGVKSPLRHVKLYKEEIRELSKEMELSTWNKQSFACLSSRFVYGETISEKKLEMVDKAEQLLLDLGFSQVRVRIHGLMARIEILPKDFEKLICAENRENVCRAFRDLGFSYVTMDLGGYRMGSMNEGMKNGWMLRLVGTSLNLRLPAGHSAMEYRLSREVALSQLEFSPDLICNYEDMECDRAEYDDALKPQFFRVAATDDRQGRGVSCWIRRGLEAEKVSSMVSPHFMHVKVTGGEGRELQVIILRILVSDSKEDDFKDRWRQWQRAMEYVDSIRELPGIVLVGDWNHGVIGDRKSYKGKPREFYNYQMIEESLRDRRFEIVPLEGFSYRGYMSIDHLAVAPGVRVNNARYEKVYDDGISKIGIPDHSYIVSDLTVNG